MSSSSSSSAGDFRPTQSSLIALVRAEDQAQLQKAIEATEPGHERRALIRKIALIALGTDKEPIARWAHQELGLKGRVTTTEALGSRNFEQTRKWIHTLKNMHRLAFYRLHTIQAQKSPSEGDIRDLQGQINTIVAEFTGKRSELRSPKKNRQLSVAEVLLKNAKDEVLDELRAYQAEATKALIWASGSTDPEIILGQLEEALEKLGLIIDVTDQLCAEDRVPLPGIGMQSVEATHRAPNKWDETKEGPVVKKARPKPPNRLRRTISRDDLSSIPAASSSSSSSSMARSRPEIGETAEELMPQLQKVLKGEAVYADGSLAHRFDYAELKYDLNKSTMDDEIIDVLKKVVQKLDNDDLTKIMSFDKTDLIDELEAAIKKGEDGVNDLKGILTKLLESLAEW